MKRDRSDSQFQLNVRRYTPHGGAASAQNGAQSSDSMMSDDGDTTPAAPTPADAPVLNGRGGGGGGAGGAESPSPPLSSAPSSVADHLILADFAPSAFVSKPGFRITPGQWRFVNFTSLRDGCADVP